MNKYVPTIIINITVKLENLTIYMVQMATSLTIMQAPNNRWMLLPPYAGKEMFTYDFLHCLENNQIGE